MPRKDEKQTFLVKLTVRSKKDKKELRRRLEGALEFSTAMLALSDALDAQVKAKLVADKKETTP